MGIALHRLIVEDGDVAHHAAFAIEHGYAEIALRSPIHESRVEREQSLQTLLVVTDFAVEHFHAGRVGNIEFKEISEAVARPHGEDFGALLIGAVCDERVSRPNAEAMWRTRVGKKSLPVADAVPTTIDLKRSSSRWRSVTSRTRPTTPIIVPSGGAMRSEDAGLPYVTPTRGMLRHQEVANIYGFPGQRSLQHVFDTAGS